MPAHHRPDSEAWPQQTTTNDAYLWPYINLGDLLMPQYMLHLLKLMAEYHFFGESAWELTAWWSLGLTCSATLYYWSRWWQWYRVVPTVQISNWSPCKVYERVECISGIDDIYLKLRYHVQHPILEHKCSPRSVYFTQAQNADRGLTPHCRHLCSVTLSLASGSRCHVLHCSRC